MKAACPHYVDQPEPRGREPGNGEANLTDKGDKQRTDCSHTRESGLDVEFTNVCRTYALRAGFQRGS
jgi:hypothetical protein